MSNTATMVRSPSSVPAVPDAGRHNPYFCRYPFQHPIDLLDFVKPVPTCPLIDQLATSDRSYIVAAPTGSGKSLFLRAAICRALVLQDKATVMVADPKAESWSGLEQLDGVVHYLTESIARSDCNLDDEAMEKLPPDTFLESSELLYWAWCIRQAKKELDRRIKVSSAARRKGKHPPKFAPLILIIDEHFGCYADYQVTPDPLKRALGISRVMPWLQNLVVKGRALGVRVILITQSHLCGEVGFSSTIRDSFGVMIMGRMQAQDPRQVFQSKDGNFSMLIKAMGDRHLIPDDQERKELGAIFRQLRSRKVLQLGLPVVLNVMGDRPQLGILPDLMPTNSILLGKIYSQLHPATLPQQKAQPPTGSETSIGLTGMLQVRTTILRVACHLRTSKEQDVITASNVVQYSKAQEPTKHMSPEAIREAFRAIAEAGDGELVGEGSSLSFRLGQANPSTSEEA